MTLRIGWLSPLTPASGVGTFSHAIAANFPTKVAGEAIDLTFLYPPHAILYDRQYRSICIEEIANFRSILGLFDFLVYNVGNNSEHHDIIIQLLRTHPGVVVCHDYIYQHYMAGRCFSSSRSFASFAALLMKFGGDDVGSYLARSRITSRVGKVRYAPWDSEVSSCQPMSEAILDLGSALVVHSRFARNHVEKRFRGPILEAGMPHDQKPLRGDTFGVWSKAVLTKQALHLVSFGHIQPSKCIDLVIEAIGASPALRRSVTYTIAGYVGDRNYFNQLEQQIAGLGLSELVHFEIGVSDVRLRKIMDDADVFVNLRRPNTEGASASVIEQLDSGRPVIVLDSGCYAEIPAQAAIKLAPEADAGDVRAALEQLVKSPTNLPAIGGAGRAYARKWTCASYGRRLVEFALEHQDLIRRRGQVTGSGDKPGGAVDSADLAWVENLAQARAAMRYIDRNVLAIDPQLVMGFDSDELCSYVARVIFGIFDDPRLYRALSRFFVSLEGSAKYWACAKFSLIVEAVFTESVSARERLAVLGPCLDPEFWNVLEALPPRHYVSAAAIILLGRSPTSEELSLAGNNGSGDSESGDRYFKHQILLEILAAVKTTTSAEVALLRRWLEQTIQQDIQSQLPLIERELDCAVGSPEFREHAELSGFFAQEVDHVWTRGARGFVGLRLSPEVLRIELIVHSVNATADQPATIKLSCGKAMTEIEVGDCDHYCLALDVPRHLTRANSTIWLELWTNRAERPNNSQDLRVLGVCFKQLKIIISQRKLHVLESQMEV